MKTLALFSALPLLTRGCCIVSIVVQGADTFATEPGTPADACEGQWADLSCDEFEKANGIKSRDEIEAQNNSTQTIDDEPAPTNEQPPADPSYEIDFSSSNFSGDDGETNETSTPGGSKLSFRFADISGCGAYRTCPGCKGQPNCMWSDSGCTRSTGVMDQWCSPVPRADTVKQPCEAMTGCTQCTSSAGCIWYRGVCAYSRGVGCVNDPTNCINYAWNCPAGDTNPVIPRYQPGYGLYPPATTSTSGAQVAVTTAVSDSSFIYSSPALGGQYSTGGPALVGAVVGGVYPSISANAVVYPAVNTAIYSPPAISTGLAYSLSAFSVPPAIYPVSSMFPAPVTTVGVKVNTGTMYPAPNTAAGGSVPMNTGVYPTKPANGPTAPAPGPIYSVGVPVPTGTGVFPSAPTPAPKNGGGNNGNFPAPASGPPNSNSGPPNSNSGPPNSNSGPPNSNNNGPPNSNAGAANSAQGAMSGVYPGGVGPTPASNTASNGAAMNGIYTVGIPVTGGSAYPSAPTPSSNNGGINTYPATSSTSASGNFVSSANQGGGFAGNNNLANGGVYPSSQNNGLTPLSGGNPSSPSGGIYSSPNGVTSGLYPGYTPNTASFNPPQSNGMYPAAAPVAPTTPPTPANNLVDFFPDQNVPSPTRPPFPQPQASASNTSPQQPSVSSPPTYSPPTPQPTQKPQFPPQPSSFQLPLPLPNRERPSGISQYNMIPPPNQYVIPSFFPQQSAPPTSFSTFYQPPNSVEPPPTNYEPYSGRFPYPELPAMPQYPQVSV